MSIGEQLLFLAAILLFGLGKTGLTLDLPILDLGLHVETYFR